MLHLTSYRGTEIWRIENFQPVPLPKSEYGKFYMGDSYIVLQVQTVFNALLSLSLSQFLYLVFIFFTSHESCNQTSLSMCFVLYNFLLENVHIELFVLKYYSELILLLS